MQNNGLLHSPVDQVRGYWPLILADEFSVVGGDPVLCLTCSVCVCSCTILLENEASW